MAKRDNRKTEGIDPENLQLWYLGERPAYESLADTVRSTLENLLKNSGIDFLSVTHRAKSIESFMDKIERKGYSDPGQEMTDLAGIRVISFIESDVPKISTLIRSSFNVHEDKSLDKSEELGVDRFGYRSVHFVCDLGNDRSKLPEFKVYKGLCFEIQVRTVLQHAWAEIEHDRSYKFSGVLPVPYRRRLSLIAGMLEIADREFNTLASELETYSEDVKSKAEKGELDVEINSTSLGQYIETIKNRFPTTTINLRSLDNAISELSKFNIDNLKDLDSIIDDGLIDAIESERISITSTGLIRSAMMYHDMERYFSDVWRGEWTGLTPATYRVLSHKYSKDKINGIMKNKNLQLTNRK